jgi:hypothetical protein
MAKYITILLLISIPSFAQITFQKGYYIDNNNERHDCFIKDEDWLNIPKAFNYRTTSESEEHSIFLEQVKEFSVNKNKYVRANVDIDNSSSDLRKLSLIRKPEFTNETLFLKVLTEGKATLYYFRKRGEDRYFFKKDTSTIQQLIYKKYIVSTTQTGINNNFQNQLRAELNCANYTDEKFKTLKYNRATLEKFFIEYNQCEGGAIVVPQDNKEKSAFHFKVTPGLDFASMQAQSSTKDVLADFESKIRPRIGAEFELTLPFNNNKWAAVSEPNFQWYKSKVNSHIPRNINYQSFELPLGLRHYFFLKSGNRIFITAIGILDVPLVYKVNLPTGKYNNHPLSSNVAFGVGYNYKKISIECRYYSKRTSMLTIPGEATDLFLDYRKTSIIFGYRIF